MILHKQPHASASPWLVEKSDGCRVGSQDGNSGHIIMLLREHLKILMRRPLIKSVSTSGDRGRHRVDNGAGMGSEIGTSRCAGSRITQGREG